MNDATRYLEAAKIDELAAELTAKGYTVEREVPAMGNAAGPHFDLVARRKNDAIAIEVKAAGAGSFESKQIAELRALAHQQGIQEFQFVVVNPPRSPTIVVNGLEDALLAWVIDHVPEALRQLSQHVRVESIEDVTIDSIHVGAGETHVVGSALLRVNLAYGGGAREDGVDYFVSFPFTFDAVLDEALDIATAEYSVDISSWDD